eukprot:SAG31_NODE_926_length_10930_cov_135.691626_5_plen_123_part_00
MHGTQNLTLSDHQFRAQMSLWAMMASPLIVSADLRRPTALQMEILGNKAVVRIDLDLRPESNTLGCHSIINRWKCYQIGGHKSRQARTTRAHCAWKMGSAETSSSRAAAAAASRSFVLLLLE